VPFEAVRVAPTCAEPEICGAEALDGADTAGGGGVVAGSVTVPVGAEVATVVPFLFEPLTSRRSVAPRSAAVRV